ncbi:hypothetical protein E0Z10_g820 [Xylaria hypoxylon]|uniref:Methyltransferase type 11 domain-containing protein n=1 Tax=Xylaria hypoxylon TaxID=37992 RepID=A0A4Z0YU29_9PEZI|nr:hypothetical protein E0Z10_g820 [Xylaria hypoxylon]
MSRILQNPSSYKQSTQSELRVSRPTLTHDAQSSSASSRSGIPMVKPAKTVEGHIESSKQPVRVLRRKQSTILKEPSNIRVRNPSRSSPPTKNSRVLYGPISPLSDQGITHISREARVAPQDETHRTMTQPTQIYPELDRYRDIALSSPREPLGRDALYRLATEDLPPPTPLFSGASSHSQLSSFSASPSTRFSGSPGPSPYSRDTTPTSICSQSPGLVAPMRLPAARVRQASPAGRRPPITRRRAGSVSNEGGSFSADPQGLAAVREALTSSSSNSTVRTEEKITKVRGRHVPAPPSPPPRKSSQGFEKGRSTDETKSSFQSRIFLQPGIRPPSPGKSHDRAPSVTPSHQRRPTPPSRPSRDGTPDLYSQFGGPVPIIHSNLSSTSLTERRQSGQLQLSSLPRATTQRSSQDRPGSARPSLSRERSASRTDVLPGPQAGKNDTGNTNKAPSPSVSTFKHKFPLFGRRTKAGPEATQTEKKRDRTPRKGPAAGTGHEGYGRVGAVKRRSSISSALRRGLSGPVSSSESLASTLSTDPFLLERMSPVIISGGEIVENQNTSFDLIRTESNQSDYWRRPSLGPRNFSATSSGAREDNRQTLWPSPSLSEAVYSQRPSDNSDSGGVTTKPRLAYQSSTSELQPQHNEKFKIPKAINTRAPSAASMATTIYTDDSFPDIQREQSRSLPRVTAPAKKLTKRPKSPRKWNIFGRSQASSSPKKRAENVSTIVKPSRNEPPAFYTTMDSSKLEGTDDRQDIKAVPREVEVPPTANAQFNYDGRPSTSSGTDQMFHTHPGKDTTGIRSKPSDSVPQIWQLDTKQENPQIGHKTAESSPHRPSRLPQVGRIPKVVASRPQQTSPKSFSRPFNRVSTQLLPAHSDQLDEDSIAKGPSPPDSVASRTPHAESPGKSLSQECLNKDQICYDGLSIPEQHGQEFLVFPPYENSGRAEGSDSSCSDTPGYVVHTAQVPEPSAPLGEDEVWDEFNDLIEGSPPSPTSSCGVPFPLETYHSNLVKESTKPLESPIFLTDSGQDARISVATAGTVTTSSHHSAEMTARINAAFRFDSEPPVTPFSVSEFVSGYGDRNTNVESNQESETPPRASLSSNEGEKIKTNSERSSQASKRTSGSSRLSEETPLSQVNLRVGSMTVSKWLTFGHVLFSPVREDLVNNDSSLKRQSILVIDGLGNDDWSFYAAETYPAANFFNLSPRAPVPQENKTTLSFPLSPSNHHQIQFKSYADKFPFGPDSFTALVFRFPAAAPEAHYRNIISEAQRVLKPGGFIEFSVLDLDLNNVGRRTRRAVRHLKEEVSTQNSDVYLSSTADLILRLLGRKGFVDIKTCRVGVPVASSITNTPKKDRKKDERSLAEMMNDKTEIGDKNITKMVSKVGRWWYNRCYEAPTGMGSSIWHDQALLAECEEWTTSLKLMVCHARVPETRGRLASI